MLIERTISIDCRTVTVTQRVATADPKEQANEVAIKQANEIAIKSEVGAHFSQPIEKISFSVGSAKSSNGPSVSPQDGGGEVVPPGPGGQPPGVGGLTVVFGPVVINCPCFKASSGLAGVAVPPDTGDD